MSEDTDIQVTSFKPYKPGFPWWRLYSMLTLVGFWALILYQVSPQFQAWCNYTYMYWSRYATSYATYSAEYFAWLVRQYWRKIPDGRK